TSAELLSLEPLAFFETILLHQLKIEGLVEGFNFRFGRERAGDNQMLRSLCEKAGLPFAEVPPLKEGDLPISTSRIRDALTQGRLHEANRWMTRPYSVEGLVGHGEKRGRTIGFPTANIQDVQTLLPAEGVYAGLVEFQNKKYR